MKKWGRLLLVAVLILGLMAVVGCAKEEAADTEKGQPEANEPAITKLVVASETTYPPFEMVENGKYVGFDMDLIQAIGEEMGCEIEIQSMGFDALIPALKANTVDATISAQSITEERLQVIDFSDPYFDAGLIVAVRTDNNNIKSYDDLAGKTLAAEVGTTGAMWSEKLKEEDPNTEVKIFDGVGEAFMELEKGSADAVINDLPVTAYYIKTTGKDKVKMVGELFSADEQYGIGVKKGNTEVLNFINEGLKRIKDNGKYDEIYQKWFGE